MNKLLFTIVIPAYNGEPFLDKSVHSIVNDRTAGVVTHLFEIIIIDDGSKDKTSSIARKIARKWNKLIGENFIRVITKKNGQYGSVINKGIKEARGLYFKVLDVDDTFNTSSFIDLLYIVAGLDKKPDVIYTDHVFEKVGGNLRDVQSLKKYFPPNKLLKFKEQEMPKDLITMHSIIYRTDFLINIGYKQVEGVYYSDSQYSLIPLLKAKSMYYIEIPLYRYYIGREEQSINLKVMVKNRLHQRIVLEAILKDAKISKNTSPHVKDFFYLSMRRMIQWQSMLIANDPCIKNKRKELIELIDTCKELKGEEYKQIAKGPFFGYLRFTRGYTLSFVIKWGIKIYAKIKKNVMAEWD